MEEYIPLTRYQVYVYTQSLLFTRVLILSSWSLSQNAGFSKILVKWSLSCLLACWIGSATACSTATRLSEYSTRIAADNSYYWIHRFCDIWRLFTCICTQDLLFPKTMSRIYYIYKNDVMNLLYYLQYQDWESWRKELVYRARSSK